MKYIADLLAVLRALLAVPIIWVVVSTGTYWLATILFIIGVLTDALDGSVARRWPYSEAENKKLFWRKGNGQLADNVGDAILFYATLIALGFAQSGWWWFAAIATVLSVVLNVLIIFVLRPRRPRWADRVDVCFRWLYGLLLFIALIGLTANAVGSVSWMIGITIGYAVLTAIVVYIKRDRARFTL